MKLRNKKLFKTFIVSCVAVTWLSDFYPERIVHCHLGRRKEWKKKLNLSDQEPIGCWSHKITSYVIESLKFSENLHITADIRRNDGDGKWNRFLMQIQLISCIISFYCFFIYKLRQEAWITHRASSTTRSRKKERKLVIQLKRMTILSKQETEMQKQNWEGHR